MERVIISNIQRFSLDDGPGIRTSVFIKGCNLHCPWCHNPETINPLPELMYYENSCKNCGACAKICPNKAHSMKEGRHIFNHKACQACGKCLEVCLHDALDPVGQKMTAEELMATIRKDAPFYAESGGGLTLSGGEPLLQADFCIKLASLCKKEQIHVLLDTAASAPTDKLKRLIPFIDACYIDLKATNVGDYKNIMGGNFDFVKANMALLAESGLDTTVRIPIIPKYTDKPETAKEFAQIIKNAGLHKVHLLPYHNLGAGKYPALSRPYSCIDIKPPDSDSMTYIKEILETANLDVKII